MIASPSIVGWNAACGDCAALLLHDFASFAARSFRELNPRSPFVTNWHVELMAGDPRNGPQGLAVRGGGGARGPDPPADHQRAAAHLKSHLASVAFPAWSLGHDSSMQILCVSYAQNLADKLSRDCRRIVASDWYQRLFPTRLSPRRQAVPEFETTAQGCRVATSVGGVLTRTGRRHHHHRRSAEARRGIVASRSPGGERVVRSHPLQPAER